MGEFQDTYQMIENLIQETIQDKGLNKEVQAKIVLSLAQAIDTLSKADLEAYRIQIEKAKLENEINNPLQMRG